MKATPLELARVCQALYGDNDQGITFDALWNFGGTVAAHTMIGDEHVIAYRGSLVLLDWLRNIEALAWPPDERLGCVHRGFFSGVPEVVAAASAVPGLEWANTAVTGHSLGGGRAPLHAGLCAVNGTPVGLVAMLAPPRPAFINLRRILEKTNTPMVAYCNRNDIVPDVPRIDPRWCHVADLIHLDVPADADDLNPWRDHSLALYIEGLQKLGAHSLPVAA